jgi:Skp family chaperone for outer membrane proteins
MSAAPQDPAAPGGFAPTPKDALEFLQRMWNPLGVPMPGFGLPGAAATTPAASIPAAPAAPAFAFPNPAMMFAALDPAEVQRKIDELKVVENWLSMSLAMMQMSVKTLELQKASLEALRGATREPAAGGKADRRRGGAAKAGDR